MRLLFFRSFASWLLLAISCLTACSPHFQATYVRQHKTVPIDEQISPDTTFTALIAPYKNQLDEKMNRVIGKADTTLYKLGIESPLGNFVADLIRTQALQYGATSVDMGMTSSGGLRIPIAAGDITVSEIYQLMPFENEIWVLTLDGATTMQLFEHLAKVKNLSVSNSQVIIENEKVKQVLINGKPLTPENTYTLATSDYLALGGDNLEFLKGAKARQALPVKLRDAIIDYIESLSRAGKKVTARVEGRVLVK
jgi:2',3'-cyclic-nucleotide 2'-phosphodiesterase (5'-nucleotidase family)